MRIRELISMKNRMGLKVGHPDDTLIDTVRTMSEHNIGALPIVNDEGDIVGIVSERDIMRALAADHAGLLQRDVGDLMTTSVLTCEPDNDADSVYELLTEKKIRHIPVVEKGKLSAILSIRDFEDAHRRTKQQALSDDLTGLHNLRHFLSILDNEFNRYRRFREPLAVASIKIDRLDRVSASQGHAASDRLVRRLAEILAEQIRAYDGVGRVADDRFAIVFPNTDAKTAARACERLVWAVRATAPGGAKEEAEFTVSIGLTFANQHNYDGGSILKRADELAAIAAVSGGDCIEVDESAADGDTDAGKLSA